MTRRIIILVLFGLLTSLLFACSTAATPTELVATNPPVEPTEKPTVEPPPIATPPPTNTPLPTETPLPSDTPLPTDTPTPEISPTPFTCNDALGCVQIDAGEAIQLGYILDLSGPAAAPGLDSLNGLELAIERAGKLAGHDVELKGADEGCDPEKGREAALNFAEEPKMIAVFGTTCSRAARAVFPWLSKAGFVILSPSNTSPMLTEEGKLTQYEGYYRVIYSEKQQGVMAAHLAREMLNVNTAYAINDNMPVIQEGFVEEFSNLGGQVLQKATIDSPANLNSLLSSVASKAPEMIYLSMGNLELAGQLIEQARETPGLENTYIVSFESLFNPELENIAGLAADGVIISQGILRPQIEEYQTEILPAYREKFGQEPQTMFHAFAIDAVNLLYTAIEQVSVLYPDGTLYIPRQALRDALYATQDFQGITGTLSCSSTGDCGDPRSIVFYTYKFGIWPPTQFWP